jgi:hypothetical protein
MTTGTIGFRPRASYNLKIRTFPIFNTTKPLKLSSGRARVIRIPASNILTDSIFWSDRNLVFLVVRITHLLIRLQALMNIGQNFPQIDQSLHFSTKKNYQLGFGIIVDLFCDFCVFKHFFCVLVRLDYA